jgi:TonB-dependent SusC/RagA subfamily outer membrane receptor
MKLSNILILISVLVISAPVSGQKTPKKITISGIVTDSIRRPVSGIIILVDNQKTNIITDEKGAYKVKVSTKAKTLSVFSMKNGISEKPIDGKTEINFTMNSYPTVPGTELKATPDDETVNVGYGTIKKKDMTTSVGKIDGTNKKYAAYNSIYEMIQGEIPGVQVTGNKIIIQGTSTFYGSTDPLFVVDGSAVTTIENISPRYVKSIEVLKGSAASIYGSRGANGVILITLVGVSEKKK